MMKNRNKGNQGFTMIELLMVIMLVAILGAVALPQFLDFRTEGRVAATQSLVSSVRSGIKLQYSQQILRCDGVNGEWPTLAAVSNNDITTPGGSCSTSEITNPAERRFVDSDNLPENPFDNSSTVNSCDGGSSAQCDSSFTSLGGWCYDATTGNFWAATDVASECDF